MSTSIDAPPRPGLQVRRSTPTSRGFTGAAGVLAVALAFVPLMFDPDTVQKLTTLLTLVLLASMWNALAGYGGMVSVGQQAFIGIGAYGTVFLARQGISPYLAMVLAALVSGVIALPISLFALRLRARDLFGNETSINALGQALRAGRARLNVRQQDLQLVNLESADSAVVVTLKAVRVGTYQFVIGSGITANVRVDAIPKP